MVNANGESARTTTDSLIELANEKVRSCFLANALQGPMHSVCWIADADVLCSLCQAVSLPRLY
jgi:hypothetical protein